jgi:hypothetical protein
MGDTLHRPVQWSKMGWGRVGCTPLHTARLERLDAVLA